MKPENKERKFKMELLAEEVLNLVGEKREEAMHTYRKLLSASADRPMYLIRS